MKDNLNNMKCLRVALATVRFDNVPSSVKSKYLSCCRVSRTNGILDYEYCIRRNLDVESFSRKLKLDLDGWLGDEIARLNKFGLKPVLYAGFFAHGLEYFNGCFGEKTLNKLAGQGRSICIVFDSEDGQRAMAIVIPKALIALLAKYHFSLELS